MNSRNIIAIALVSIVGNAQAELFDRGGGLIYDDVLKVTWLQDANYAQTSGYDADGRMNWSAANIWAANLVYHDSVRNVDYSDWRLPTVSPVNWNSFNHTYSANGTTDLGYNITSPASQLSYMYYVNLGLNGYCSTANVCPQTDWGVHGDGTSGGQADVGLVKSLQSYYYWSGTVYEPYPANFAWFFNARYGSQYNDFQSSEFHAWAVRPGDVAAIPEPEAYAMMLAGLGLLGAMGRCRNLNG